MVSITFLSSHDHIIFRSILYFNVFISASLIFASDYITFLLWNAHYMIFKISVPRNFLLLLVISNFFPEVGRIFLCPFPSSRKYFSLSDYSHRLRVTPFLIEMILFVCKILNNFSSLPETYLTLDFIAFAIWNYWWLNILPFERFFINFFVFIYALKDGVFSDFFDIYPMKIVGQLLLSYLILTWFFRDLITNRIESMVCCFHIPYVTLSYCFRAN